MTVNLLEVKFDFQIIAVVSFGICERRIDSYVEVLAHIKSSSFAFKNYARLKKTLSSSLLPIPNSFYP